MGKFYDFQNWAVPQGLAFKRVFVTSTSWMGTDLGGISGADRKCQGASRFPVTGGIYKAWISDRAPSGPSYRFERSDYLDSLPYYLIDGKTRVANDWGSLTSDDLLHPINMTNRGKETVGPLRVWTNTRRDGTRRSDTHCLNWSGGPGSTH